MPSSPGRFRAVLVVAVIGVIAAVSAVRALREASNAPPIAGPAPTSTASAPVSNASSPQPSAAGQTTPSPSSMATEVASTEVEAGTSRRYYEVLQDGKKAGWTRVEWSKSTWKGHETVRDVTTSHSRESRMMLGTEDVFESESVQETERGIDGALYSAKSRSTERGGRVTTGEITWTGSGYDSVTRIREASGGAASSDSGASSEERHHADASTPAHVDAEALVSAKASAGTLHVGDRFVRRQLNLLGARIDERPVVVNAEEDVDGPSGRVRTWKLTETDPKDGSETYLWIDHEGAFARLKELSTELRRVPTKARAENFSGPKAAFSITAKAEPKAQRVFSADQMEVEIGVSPDADRPRPVFPDSPWSKTLEVKGDDAKGYTVRVRLSAYDAKDAHATIPVSDPAFLRELEPTAHMPCRHPDVKAAALRAVGNETDARKAASLIAAFVFTLEKESPEVAEATALEILRDRKGDCSEHALLFVALCRAAGIPARRCSGFVCVGDDWGSHAWAEIWCGAWMGVDPTTNDVGTSARYLFYGYPDDPDSHSGTVSARARGRLSFRGLSLDEGADHVDLTDTRSLRSFDAERRVAVDRLSGLELRDLPLNWHVTFRRNAMASIRTSSGGEVFVRIQADQGYRSLVALASMVDGRPGTFAGRPCVVSGDPISTYFIPSRRRIVHLRIDSGSETIAAVVATLEKAMAPTFAEPAVAPK